MELIGSLGEFDLDYVILNQSLLYNTRLKKLQQSIINNYFV